MIDSAQLRRHERILPAGSLTMDVLFNWVDWFAARPDRAFAIAWIFIAAGLIDRRLVQRDPRIKPWAMFVPAAAWLAIAIHEHYAKLNGWHPRFDLYITGPTVAILSIAFAVIWIQNVRRIWRERNTIH
jgi:hypothetical protein